MYLSFLICHKQSYSP